MSFLKTLWGLLFRLFPCPTATGLRRLGAPGPHSPVLVTCNFDLTVKRVTRALRGVDAWLLVADSKGVNVWCAAGGEELDTHAVVAVLKTSGIAEQVRHRTLILPPLAAPGVRAREVTAQTGWRVRFGPVRAADLPRYLAEDRRTEAMKRVTYGWRERLDTALGSLFVFYLLGALGVALASAHLLLPYVLVGAGAFLLFMLACPWLPGKHGLTKALALEIPLAGGLVANELLGPRGGLRADLIIAMIVLLVVSGELGGLASTMASELDPVLARLGVGAIGNTRFAGTIRTELLNGDRVLCQDHARCKGCRQCVEVCPQGVWEMGEDRRAVLAHSEACTACRACLVQCESGAIEARPAAPAGQPPAAHDSLPT